MSDCTAKKLPIRQCSALLVVSAVFVGFPTVVMSRPARVAAGEQRPFHCHVDNLYNLYANKTAGSDDALSAKSPHKVDEEVDLFLNAESRQITLTIKVEGGPTRANPLHDIEQGSSLGSGAGGRADTTIRGRGGASTFILFASYDNNGLDHNAALQIIGANNTLLTCDSDMYDAPNAKGVGRTGLTNIYVLAADNVAGEMRDLPAEPDIQDRR